MCRSFSKHFWLLNEFSPLLLVACLDDWHSRFFGPVHARERESFGKLCDVSEQLNLCSLGRGECDLSEILRPSISVSQSECATYQLGGHGKLLFSVSVSFGCFGTRSHSVVQDGIELTIWPWLSWNQGNSPASASPDYTICYYPWLNWSNLCVSASSLVAERQWRCDEGPWVSVCEALGAVLTMGRELPKDQSGYSNVCVVSLHPMNEQPESPERLSRFCSVWCFFLVPWSCEVWWATYWHLRLPSM